MHTNKWAEFIRLICRIEWELSSGLIGEGIYFGGSADVPGWAVKKENCARAFRSQTTTVAALMKGRISMAATIVRACNLAGLSCNGTNCYLPSEAEARTWFVWRKYMAFNEANFRLTVMCHASCYSNRHLPSLHLHSRWLSSAIASLACQKATATNHNYHNKFIAKLFLSPLVCVRCKKRFC